MLTLVVTTRKRNRGRLDVASLKTFCRDEHCQQATASLCIRGTPKRYRGRGQLVMAVQELFSIQEEHFGIIRQDSAE